MAYVGGSLASLFGRKSQAATTVAARAMAHRGGDRMVTWTVKNTPIDSGNLRTSWYQIRVHRVAHLLGPAYESGVATDVDYAPHVEHGTGLWGPSHSKYLIEPHRPGGFLRWTDPATGQEVFARRVWHPGSPGQHMVAIAAAMTEAEIDGGVLFGDILDDWANTVEANAD